MSRRDELRSFEARLTALAGNFFTALGRDRVVFGNDRLDGTARLSTTIVPAAKRYEVSLRSEMHDVPKV